MIDLNNIKEEFLNFCKNSYTALLNSSAVFFLKEKYYHLSPSYRKALHFITGGVLAVLFLYYPVFMLYSSSGYIKDSKTKQTLLQDLMVVSSLRSTGSGSFYSSKKDIVSLIRQKMRAMQIPEKQIQKIKKTTNKKAYTKLSVLAKATAVEVAMEKLNLKEVVQYGHQMEQFANNIKLVSIQIQEDTQIKNYFNVSYVLHIFRNTKSKVKTSTNKDIKS